MADFFVVLFQSADRAVTLRLLPELRMTVIQTASHHFFVAEIEYMIRISLKVVRAS